MNSILRTLLFFVVLTAVGFAADDLAATKKKAEAGDEAAQIMLGSWYLVGEGVPKDSAEAVKWYRKAADQGNAGAQNNLGLMYANGDGVPKDSADGRIVYAGFARLSVNVLARSTTMVSIPTVGT